VTAQGRRYSAHIALGVAWLAVMIVAPNLRPTGATQTRVPVPAAAPGASVRTPTTTADPAVAADTSPVVPVSDFLVDAAPTELQVIEEPRDDTLAPPPPAPEPAATAETPADPEPPATAPGPASQLPAIPSLPSVPAP
jgi:hypothetical protein